MTMSFEDICDHAESLPRERREILVDLLLRSLDAEPDAEVMAAWLQVAHRRLKEYRSGKLKAIPVEEVFSRRKTGE